MSRSPRIVLIEWGHIELEDGSVFKDAKLFPGGSRAWDWNETGTRHAPGTQPADAQELLDQGAESIVLTRGMELVLQVSPATVMALERHGVEVIVEETRAAAAIYNDLVAAGRRVAGLFHSTC